MIMFKDRIEAGRLLADKIEEEYPVPVDPIVLGIPRGGIAAGYGISRRLNCPLEPLTLRKLPVPWHDQVGFGAVTIDKKVFLNNDIVSEMRISQKDINKVINEVYLEVQRRDKIYRGSRPFPQLKERTVIIADDGLATGYTMLAAVEFVRDKGPEKIIVAVPVASLEAYNMIKKQAENMACLHISTEFSFAVASFYSRFDDMEDKEVVEIITNARENDMSEKKSRYYEKIS